MTRLIVTTNTKLLSRVETSQETARVANAIAVLYIPCSIRLSASLPLMNMSVTISETTAKCRHPCPVEMPGRALNMAKPPSQAAGRDKQLPRTSC